MSEENLESEPGAESHPTWEISFAKGEIQGLPQGVEPNQVIVFLGPDGKWYAQNPSQELLDEIGKWRTDWD